MECVVRSDGDAAVSMTHQPPTADVRHPLCGGCCRRISNQQELKIRHCFIASEKTFEDDGDSTFDRFGRTTTSLLYHRRERSSSSSELLSRHFYHLFFAKISSRRFRQSFNFSDHPPTTHRASTMTRPLEYDTIVLLASSTMHPFHYTT